MATNDLVVLVTDISAPSVDGAYPDVRAGGSTPGEIFTVWAFIDTATSYLDLKFWLSTRYSGNGLTFILPWAATAATTGAVHWEAAIRRIADDAEDLDASHTYDYNSVNATTASAAGELDYATITFTDGADMDNLVAGEWAYLRIRRVPGDASDNLGEIALLFDAIGKET